MWTIDNLGRYDRSKLRYPRDLMDAEWPLVAPLIPRAKRGGNKRAVDVREIVNGIMYILGTGCQWAAMPRQRGTRCQSDDRNHRQPERQGRGKRGHLDRHGYDAAKQIKGKKRRALVDTQGLLTLAAVHAADIQDHDGGVLKLYADGGYQRPKFQRGLHELCREVSVEIVKRSDADKFVVPPSAGS